jgi:acyl-CoA synthetase (AMP-forming)/AMP-acid ligase II
VDHAVETLLSLAASQPDAQLLSTRGRTYSYAAFVERAAGVLAALRAAGFARGDHVATLLEEYDAFFAALFAVWLGGGVVVPLNTSLPQRDIDWLVAKSQPRFAVTPGADTTLADGPRRVVLAADAIPSAPVADLDVIGPDELAMIVFTSGTTGVPKGVCQHVTAMSVNAAQVAGVLDLSADDRVFINTPPYFTSGICHFLTLLARGGGTTGQLGFFFGQNLLAEMDELGCTGFGGAPAHLVRVVEPMDEPWTGGGLRFWVSSGDHLPVKTIDRMRRVLPGVRLYNMYGLTEVSGRLCVLPPDEIDRREGSVGVPIGDMTVTARRGDGTPTEPGESGELYVAGPLVMQGYLDEPEITARSLTRHGFRTGDFGHTDDDGFVWIEGRKDDIIKRGGEKVSMVHVQQGLMSLGLFADAAVVAADDEMLGHVPVALVVPRDREGFKQTRVLRQLKAVLPASHLPSRVVAVDEIPRTGSGKAIRTELQKLLEEAAR